MSRMDRLLRLQTLLRVLPQPVTAARLAAECGVTERTIYRDIDTLRAAGAIIDGAAGYGYALTEDPALPPQMFTRIEVEALTMALGAIQSLNDPVLADAGGSALKKIVASLPERIQRQAAHAVFRLYRRTRPPAPPQWMELIRNACWMEETVAIRYRDAEGAETGRSIWPLAISFSDDGHMLLAWCLLRQDYRRFMLSRIVAAEATGHFYRPRRVGLLRDYAAKIERMRATNMSATQQ